MRQVVSQLEINLATKLEDHLLDLKLGMCY